MIYDYGDLNQKRSNLWWAPQEGANPLYKWRRDFGKVRLSGFRTPTKKGGPSTWTLKIIGFAVRACDGHPTWWNLRFFWLVPSQFNKKMGRWQNSWIWDHPHTLLWLGLYPTYDSYDQMIIMIIAYYLAFYSHTTRLHPHEPLNLFFSGIPHATKLPSLLDRIAAR